MAAFVAAGPCGAPGEHVAALRSELEPHIRANVLGAALVQLTMPGVPDVYQGTEGEYLALVDPDNRRPVRFPPEDPGDKNAVTAAALRLRARRPRRLRGRGDVRAADRARARRRRTVWRSRAPERWSRR